MQTSLFVVEYPDLCTSETFNNRAEALRHATEWKPDAACEVRQFNPNQPDNYKILYRRP